EPRAAARLGDMGLELTDVDPVRADDAALDIAHAGDHTALTPEQAGRDAPDVAESLDDDALPAERLAEVACCLVESVHDAATRGFPPPCRAADDERLAGDDPRDRLALGHRVGIHHPRHRLLVGATVRARAVLVGPDHEQGLDGGPTRRARG